MPRLTLMGILTLALFAMPLSVGAQQTRVYRIGVVLQGGPSAAAIDGLRDGLRELGLEEGKQFVVHVRDVKGDPKAAEAAARGLEGEKVDLIWALHTSTTLAVKRATRSVPIVFLRRDRSGGRRPRRELPETGRDDSRASMASSLTSRRSVSSF